MEEEFHELILVRPVFILTQSQSPVPLVKPPSTIQTVTQSAAKDASRSSSPISGTTMPSPPPDSSSPAIPPRQVNFSAHFSPLPPPAEKQKREPKLYIDDNTEKELQNLTHIVTPLKGKNGGVSIEKVKEMLKGMTLSELTDFLLNKNKKQWISQSFCLQSFR